MFTLAEGAKLVELARHSIKTLATNSPLELEQYKVFNQTIGVYVTLKKEGRIRGQMGVIETEDPLYQAVLKAARDAAFNDKRFDKVNEDELKEISVEVAIILNPRLLRVRNFEEYYKMIHPETDGLMIRSGVYNAIMLPNPEMRLGWDVERVLKHLCLSAGLTMDAWKSLDDNIYVFQTQIFAERNKKIVELV